MTHAICVLIFPDFQILDAAGPIAAFEIAGRAPGSPRYSLSVVAADPASAVSSSGVGLSVRPLDEAGPIDTLLVAGGEGVLQAVSCTRTLDFILQASARGARIASVCSGSFLLAEAGLLDGAVATTHWNAADEFRRRYPRVALEADRIFTRSGPIWTSAGITAGIDLALALIAQDYGERLARETARMLVVFHRRPGGQSQFSAVLDLQERTDRFAPVLAWARERLAEPLTVEDLAGQAGLSARQFARAFTAATGVTPAKAVERLRVEAARAQVEASSASVERVCAQTGFGDPERMRRAFIRAFGQPPQALRRAARTEGPSPP